MQLSAGNQVLLNLHLFNPSDQPLRGRSGVSIHAVDVSAVRELADGMIIGATQLDVPPGRSTSVGRCTLDRAGTFLSVFPHMHQTGVSIQIVAHSRDQGDVMLFDGPYDFDSQLSYPIDRLTLQAGDVIEVDCTYENTSARVLHWGQSSRDEMCNAGLTRLPAGGPSICNR